VAGVTTVHPVWVAEVVVEIRTKALDRHFDYWVPASLQSSVQLGQRVLVPFGRKTCQGYVVALHQRDEEAVVDRRMKTILSALDDRPVLTLDLLLLTEWLTKRYVCTRLEAIQAVLPSAFRITLKERYQRTQMSLQADASVEVKRVVQTLLRGPLTLEQVLARTGPDAWLALQQAVALGAVEAVTIARDKVSERVEAVLVATVTAAELAVAASTRRRQAVKQVRILDLLCAAVDAGGGSDSHGGQALAALNLAEHALRPSDPAVAALVAEGLVQVNRRPVRRLPVATNLGESSAVESVRPTLTRWQARAVAGIEAAMAAETADNTAMLGGVLEQRPGRQLVLHGVTGSGKTEVYLRAIARCLAANASSIVLVPEISLTPQMVERFTRRFGASVTVLHSALSAGERRDAWMLALAPEPVVVIGARSAVFAPVHKLGLIIVDEEHEPSYKQEETPYYDAREVAGWRAQQSGALVVFGSATPSLEAMVRVERGQASIVVMPQRVNGNALPPVEIVDMRDELKAGNRTLFSRALRDGLESAVGAGNQAILFLNRRGYSAFLLCRNCGYRAECPNCDISLTLHRGKRSEWLKCHYCQYTTAVPEVCPDCDEPALRPFGVGTQQVEEFLREHWPEWRVLRMDVDTTGRKGAHQDLIGQFARREADVLIGTQMVAKGLDFPNVAFVGVISADTMLAVPDYRANERTFTLLTQVAGRSGRANVPGWTVVQTYRPDHYAIQTAARHDYTSFYQRERAAREAYFYPPFCELAVMLATHAQQHVAEGAAKRFERELRRRLTSGRATILPAAPSSIGRVEGRFRYQVVVKYAQWSIVESEIRQSYVVIADKMRKLDGYCVLDVQAGRI